MDFDYLEDWELRREVLLNPSGLLEPPGELSTPDAWLRADLLNQTLGGQAAGVEEFSSGFSGTAGVDSALGGVRKESGPNSRLPPWGFLRAFLSFLGHCPSFVSVKFMWTPGSLKNTHTCYFKNSEQGDFLY